MGTAIVVAVVSGIVALAGVIANYLTTRNSSRQEAARARETREAEDERSRLAREAEDRRLRDSRKAEGRRREHERESSRDVAAAAARSLASAERWAAVRKLVTTEAQVVLDPPMYAAAYQLELQSLSLLTHPEEANLRSALRQRGLRTRGPVLNVVAQVQPQWWHPWVSEWAANPDRPMIFGDADEGRVF